MKFYSYLLPDCPHLRKEVIDAANAGLAIAELEYVGITLRTITLLEESKYSILFLSQLLSLKRSELLEIFPAVQGLGIEHIINALERISELEYHRDRWHNGSKRLNHYKKQIKRNPLFLA